MNCVDFIVGYLGHYLSRFDLSIYFSTVSVRDNATLARRGTCRQTQVQRHAGRIRRYSEQEGTTWKSRFFDPAQAIVSGSRFDNIVKGYTFELITGHYGLNHSCRPRWCRIKDKGVRQFHMPFRIMGGHHDVWSLVGHHHSRFQDELVFRICLSSNHGRWRIVCRNQTTVLKADALFEQTTEFSTLSETNINYAAFLASQGRAAEARKCAERVLAKKPTMPSYLRQRERVWFRKAKGLIKKLPT